MSTSQTSILVTRSFQMQIIHLYLPKTVENYSQEVGRAGRDGLPSTCVMFLASPDIPTLEGFCRGDACSEKDLQLWLQEVVTKQPAKDGTLDFNHYKQSKEYVVLIFICTETHRASSYDIRVSCRSLKFDTATLYHVVSKMFSAYVMLSWNWIMD
jgi:superfamily II DNA helicase RecQ